MSADLRMGSLSRAELIQLGVKAQYLVGAGLTVDDIDYALTLVLAMHRHPDTPAMLARVPGEGWDFCTEGSEPITAPTLSELEDEVDLILEASRKSPCIMNTTTLKPPDRVAGSTLPLQMQRGEAEATIARNNWGGWSIFLHFLRCDAPVRVGNFATEGDGRRRAELNGWSLSEPPAHD